MNFIEYANCDGIELSDRIRAGAVSCIEVLEIAYEIIDKLDDPINAFVSLEKNQAYSAAKSTAKGPLTGVPIAMKDCVGLVKGVNRSFGSRLAVGTEIDFDEEVVIRYKAAGLIPMGTTNAPEFSSSVSTESLLHGACRNPWHTGRSSGGSSGGSAAAVACGMVPVAYGNDAAGSIRVPASCCGVFGFKPSRGRVPLGPIYGDIWFGLMVHHVITRSVRDSAIVLDLSEGIDTGAPYGVPDKEPNFIDELSRPAPRLRIAISDGNSQGYSIAPACSRALDDTATLLTEMGHAVTLDSPDYDGAEIVEHLTNFIAIALAEEIPSIAAETGREIGKNTVEACHLALMERGMRLDALQLSRGLEYKNRLGRELGRFLSDYDVLVTPTLAEPPIELGVLDTNTADLDGYLDRMWRYCPFTPLANVCGVPSMSVPLAWTDDGLPVGVMFTGRYGDDGTLFNLAGELERSSPWRDMHPPTSVWNL